MGGLIEEMIVRLEKEAAEEAAHKAYCDKEFKETYAKEEDKKAEIDKLTTAINKAKARSALLKGEVATLTKEQDVKYRTKEFTGLDKTITELSSDLAGVEEELSAVLEYLEKIKEACI